MTDFIKLLGSADNALCVIGFCFVLLGIFVPKRFFGIEVDWRPATSAISVIFGVAFMVVSFPQVRFWQAPPVVAGPMVPPAPNPQAETKPQAEAKPPAESKPQAEAKPQPDPPPQPIAKCSTGLGDTRPANVRRTPAGILTGIAIEPNITLEVLRRDADYKGQLWAYVRLEGQEKSELGYIYNSFLNCK
jgi:hypothetical protein